VRHGSASVMPVGLPLGYSVGGPGNPGSMSVLGCAARGSVLDGLPEELRHALGECGVDEAALVRSLFDGGELEALEIVRQLLPGLEVEKVVELSAALVGLWDACAEPAARRVRQLASSSVTEEEVKARILERVRLASRTLTGGVWATLERAKLPQPGSRQLGRWPTRPRRDLAAAGCEQAREKAEIKERERWLVELTSIVREARLPLALLAEKSPNPEAVLRRGAQGRRAATLRKRLRDWRRARAYFVRALGSPWPAGVGEVLEYIEARASPACVREHIAVAALAGEAVSMSAMSKCLVPWPRSGAHRGCSACGR
jgi:hypothetical protein